MKDKSPQTLLAVALLQLAFVASACTRQGDDNTASVTVFDLPVDDSFVAGLQVDTDIEDLMAEAPSEESAAAAPADDGYRLYGVEKGIIRYQKSGAQTGQETLYFEQWGRREVTYEESTTVIGDVRLQTNQMTKIDGPVITVVDLAARTKEVLRDEEQTALLERLHREGTRDIGGALMQTMGARHVGTEMVAGKEADVWSIDELGSKTWLWQSLPLKTEVRVGNQLVVSEATEVQIDADVPETVFQVPPDVTAS